VLIGGFSMGGQLALWLALSQSLPVRGFIAVGPYLPDLEGWQALVEGVQGRGLRGYIITGEQDGTIPHDTLCTLVEWLNAHDIPCRMEELPGVGHGLAPELRESLERALEFVANTKL
jgi:predicted esterase